MKIAVVGGGISGLSAAFYALRTANDVCVTLFESQSRLGGVLQTTRQDDYLVEHAADNFLHGPTAPWGEQLCHDLGFSNEIIPTSEQNRGANVVWRGNFYPVPQGFQLMAPSQMSSIMTSGLLTPAGKLRLCWEPFVCERAGDDRDESLTEFATRRLGAEAFQRLVQPLVSGIYTADPDLLSAPAALPQMVEMVQRHGSLYRAMRRRQKQRRTSNKTRGARYGLFVAPRGGMQQLVDKLSACLQLAELRMGVGVETVEPFEEGGWTVVAGGHRSRFDAVVLALPAYHAATLLSRTDPALSDLLNGISYASSAVLALGVHRDQIQRPLNAFGSVVPIVEGRQILAISYSSLKFPGRAPTDRVLMRVFLGGALQPELVDLPDDQLYAIVWHELKELLGLRGRSDLQRVFRWRKAMPQYNLGHLSRLNRIRERVALQPGLFLAGNGYEGVGIPQCVKGGKQAAEDAVTYVRGRVH